MKKLFTLLALMACFLGVKAVEVTDFTIDYAEKGAGAITWKDGAISDEWITADEDGLHFYNPAPMENWYSYQVWIFGGATLEVGQEYTIKVIAKVSEGSATVRSKIGDWGGGFSANLEVNSTDYAEYTFSGEATVGSNGLFVQFGDYVGTLSFKSVTISHEQAEGQKPTAWKESMLDNGDAEKDWPEWAFTEFMEDGVNTAWRSARATEICAWGLVRGKNIDASQTPDPVNDPDGNPIAEGKPRPFPADIEEVDGSRAFVVHTTAADNQYSDWQAWDNQFFIMAPKGFKPGTKFKIHFKYKATTAANTQTQIHHENPSWYLHYVGIGDVNFTDQWQEFDQEVTVSGWSDALGYCIAFNLNVSNKDPNDFYFDDITWQEMDLEEGFFVAFQNEDKGIKYNYANATAFEEGEIDGEPALVATVGTAGDADTWVKEVTISTVRGDNSQFKANSLVLDGDFAIESWIPYKAASGKAIKLPAAGVWQIGLDDNESMLYFKQLEGESPKEKIDIKTNPIEYTLHAVERSSADWDNQFFIVADRELEPDEETFIEFTYYIVSDELEEAKVSTQTHGKPQDYKGGGIGDLTFTTTPQTYSQKFVIPKPNNGKVQSLVFNMACVDPACDYVIKDIMWKLNDDTESLISQTEGTNFWGLIGGGKPAQYPDEPRVKPTPDVNGDTVVDALDIQDVIGAIVAGDNSEQFDVNHDGVVDALDIQDIISTIVSQ